MSYTAWMVLIISALAAATLFFSLCAASLRLFSRGKLQQLLKRKGRETKADTLPELVAQNCEKLIFTCSLYRLILNASILLLLLALFAQIRQTAPLPVDYLLTLLIAAALFFVFSLAIPHAWAKYASEKVLASTYYLLAFFAAIAAPLLAGWKLVDKLVRRLAGVPKSTLDQQQEEKQEEFLNGLEQRRIEGVVDQEQQEMIENILELSDTTADEIMTPRTDVVAVEVNSDLKTVINTITSAGHTRVPVYEENIDNIIGFIYAKDLLAQVGKDTSGFKLRDKLRPAYFVPETKPLRVLLHEFQNRKLHVAVVLDEYGGTAGIVTLEDILEELVGEITDEYEKTPPKPIKKIDPDTIEVDARTYVNDLNDEFEMNLPEDEDYDTLGGFIFSHLGYIPKTGVTFDYQNLNFTVTAAEPRRIISVRIKKTVEENADQR